MLLMSHKFDIAYNLFFKLDVIVNPSTNIYQVNSFNILIKNKIINLF